MATPSIRQKLTAALLITSTSVLLLTGLALVAYEFTTYRQLTVRQVTTLADTVAANSAGALAFEDQKVAQEILSALRSEPEIESACLFDKAGHRFADWSPVIPERALPQVPGPDGVRFLRDHVVVVEPVLQKGARIGTLFVEQSLTGMYARVTTFVAVVVLVVGAAVAIAILLAKFFEKRIARPILALANTARRISDEKDFTLRAPATTGAEMERLTLAFNEMLSEIQRHQRQVADELVARQQAEAELRASEERFRAVAENIPQLAWMARADGWLMWYNRRWYDYTGTTLEQMQGWGWQAVHHPEHLQRVTNGYKQALAGGQPWEDTFPLRSRTGEYRWFLSRAFPIRDGDGKIMRWFGTNTDITELRDVQEALSLAKAELQRHAAGLEQTVQQRTAQLLEANENLQTFSYTAAHDLRSPLRTIRSFSAVILEDFGEVLDPQIKAHLDRVSGAAGQMERLLNDLLEYSRLSQAELHLEPVSLQLAVREVLALLTGDIQAKGALVEVEGRLPTVLGHNATLVLLIQNLLSNALKFMPPGIVPRVRIYAEMPAAVTDSNTVGGSPGGSNGQEGAGNGAFGAKPRAGFARLYVADNDIGIPGKDLHRLFSAFQRLHGGKDYPGTGLGLVIVRKGAERMGGSVGVASEPGHGSRFWIELSLPS